MLKKLIGSDLVLVAGFAIMVMGLIAANVSALGIGALICLSSYVAGGY